jgi:hypothetical protein
VKPSVGQAMDRVLTKLNVKSALLTLSPPMASAPLALTDFTPLTISHANSLPVLVVWNPMLIALPV